MAAEPAPAQAAAPGKRWLVAPRIGVSEQRQLGADSLLLAQLLWNRGVRTPAAATDFLTPGRLATLGDPFSMQGMEAAVACLVGAIRQGAPIAVYGDYDVDGVAGAALLVEALRAVGATVLVHVPHRVKDGYGLNEAALTSLAEQGAAVVITVDCGITAAREVELAAALGMKVIVTDHHTIPSQLPAASAVLNPHQADCKYPCKDLAGGGVAFQLARGVLSTLLPAGAAEEHARGLADLAALSTVADVVPVVGENRTLVTLGLATMRAGQRPGIRALCAVAARAPAELSARDLAFSIIPRLNAAGRMGEARDALELLLARDEAEAQRLAGQLDSTNHARRQLVQDLLGPMLEEAAESVAAGAVVLDGPYPIGLAGLLAARVVDRWQVPSVVIQQGESVCRGSARAPEGADLMELLGECSDLLSQFGGHPRAAGFTIPTANIEQFRSAFAAATRSAVRTPVDTTIAVDAALRLQSVGPTLADLIERFEPLGEGNPPPMFVSRGTALSIQESGDGPRRVRIRDGEAVRRAVMFQSDAECAAGSRVDLVYEIRRSLWRGDQRIDLIVRNIRPAGL